MNIAVIFPAAGVGRRFFTTGRFAAAASKIEVPLADKPVFLRSLEAFRHRSDISTMVLAVAPDRLDAFKLQYGDRLGFLGVKTVAGGTKERWETVLKAMDAIDPQVTHVAVHDAARPLTSPALIDRVFDAAEKHPAVIPGHPVAATLKRVEAVQTTMQQADPLDAILGGRDDAPPAIQRVVETVDRRDVVEVQTPQVFQRALLQQAYERLAAGDWADEPITDDAGLIERMGETVYVVEGEATNLKITRPADLDLAELIARSQDQTAAAQLGAKRLFGDEED